MHYNKRNLYDSIFNIEQRKAHDYVSGQKFKINNKVLTFMLKEFNKKDKSIFFEGCNIYKSNLSTINLEEFNKEVKLNIISQISKCNLYKRILSLAIVYENVDFYIPTFMDFRGRIYSGVDYLNYQGEDVARSLIEFSKGCDINEKNIIYVLQQLANTAGKSKLNIENKNK
jgi:DNA-directed RNA polymerase